MYGPSNGTNTNDLKITFVVISDKMRRVVPLHLHSFLYIWLFSNQTQLLVSLAT